VLGPPQESAPHLQKPHQTTRLAPSCSGLCLLLLIRRVVDPPRVCLAAAQEQQLLLLRSRAVRLCRRCGTRPPEIYQAQFTVAQLRWQLPPQGNLRVHAQTLERI